MGGSVCRIKARQSFPAPVSTPGVLFVLSITDRTHWDREQRWEQDGVVGVCQGWQERGAAASSSQRIKHPDLCSPGKKA